MGNLLCILGRHRWHLTTVLVNADGKGALIIWRCPRCGDLDRVIVPATGATASVLADHLEKAGHR